MNLKTYIKEARVRQRDLAEMVQCSQPALSQIVTGKRRPSPELALRIQVATGGQVTVLELLYGQAAEQDAA